MLDSAQSLVDLSTDDATSSVHVPSKTTLPWSNLALITGCLLLPLLFFGVEAWRTYADTFQQTVDDANREVAIIQQQAYGMLQMHQLVAERVNERIRGMSWSEIAAAGELRAYLASIAQEYPQVQAIWLADADGLLRTGSRRLPTETVNVSDRAYFRTLREADKGTYVSMMRQAQSMVGLDFSVVRRKEGTGNAFDGVIIVTAAQSQLVDQWRSILPSDDDLAGLYRLDGAILARVPPVTQERQSLPASSRVLQAVQANAEGWVRSRSPIDGTSRITAYRSVPQFGVFVAYGVELRRVFAQWRARLLYLGVPLVVVTAGLVFLAGLACRRSNQLQLAAEHWQSATLRLEAANKELEEFSYSVSHDLRTPLRAISGFAQILSDEYSKRLDQEGRRLLGVITAGADRMGRLIDGILAFVRLGRLEIHPDTIAMDVLVASVVEDIRQASGSRWVRFEISPLPSAWGDRALIRQVWANLLDNAVKFTSPRHDAVIRVCASAGAHEVEYSVSDNGVGFDMRYAGKLFGVFQRLHGPAEFDGTGIGLAIVKRIVGKHGGRVWAHGQPGQGATFCFALPTRR